MATTVIGKKEPKVVDPNMIDPDKPNVRVKDGKECFFVQAGRVFNSSGYVILSAESSKKDIWNMAQTEMGAQAVAAAGLTVPQSEVKEEERNGELIFQCKDCPKSFQSQESLTNHVKIHKPPKGVKVK